jgi:hypothetical protein
LSIALLIRFRQTQNSRQGLFVTLPFDFGKNVPGSDQRLGKKMLNARITDSQRGAALQPNSL